MGTVLCTRGRLLATVGAAAAAALVFRPLASWAAAEGERILVLIAQNGGCDLLNTVVPLEQYGRYHDLRAPKTAPYDKILNLCLPEERLEHDALAGGLALHPAMRPLKALFDGGRLAVLTGVGVPAADANRLSHEAARFDWQTGTTGQMGQQVPGWLGAAVPPRSFPPLFSTVSPLPAVFQGGTENGVAIGPSMEDFASLDPPGPDDGAAYVTQTSAEGSALSAVRNARALSAQVKEIAAAGKAEDYPKADGDLDAQLKTIARAIMAGAGCRAYFAMHDGYDTHAEQNRTHPELLATFAGAIARFYGYLRARGVSRNVAIATFTDFGRRPQPDGNFGTDHGTAQAAFVLGDDVRGGLYGEYPRLDKLDGDGNLDVSVDFRDHLTTIADYLGLDPARTGLTRSNLGYLPRA